MNIILLKNFNNYFNRILKHYDFKEQYMYQSDDYYLMSGTVNFMPNDGVDTRQVVNKCPFVPDYLLVIDPEHGDEIVSRWFVMDWIHSAGTSHTAILRRDVIADNYEALKEAPIFVEKGMINNPDNPLIFNNEGMTYNEIKRKETLLKDETKIGWLVGYMIQKFPDNEVEKKFTAEYSYFQGAEAPINYEEVEKQGININFNPTIAVKTVGSTKYQSLRTVRQAANYQPGFTIKIVKGKALPTVEVDTGKEPMQWIPLWKSKLMPAAIGDLMQTWANSYKDKISRFIKISYANLEGALENEFIETFNKKLITKDGKVYRLEMTKKDVSYPKRISGDKDFQSYINAFAQIVSYSPKLYEQFINQTLDNNSKHVMDLEETITEYVFKAIPAEASSTGLEVTVKSTRNHLSDAPYDMFCIPFDKDNVEKTSVAFEGETKIDLENILSLVMAKGMAVSGGGLGSSNTYVYDIQYLPYCPIPELKQKAVLSFDSTGRRTFKCNLTNGFTEDKDYSIVRKSSGDKAAVSVIFWATRRSGTFNIPYNKEFSNDPLVVKISNETEKLRLCSPNYSGLFEFVPAKNKGVTNINVDYTYKPMNPYIHLNPDFKGLYGKDFNDSRGLVVGGDFSLETLSDKFLNYELQNKNYRQMFDREIQNMDVNNHINLTSDITSGILSSVGAGIGGAVAGGMAGGLPGAVAGGVVSGVGSLVGGAVDIALGQEKFQEAKRFKTDMFGYSLGNIKALPRSLTKTSAFTFNHKVFPFIEEYGCTDEEIEALMNKIKYNGMTIMATYKFKDFLREDEHEDYEYFKGQVIRLDSICEDNHLAMTIYEELNKGVYL